MHIDTLLSAHIHCLHALRDITAAWAGGKRGRQVIDRFLPQAAELLSHKGAFYLVVVQENRPQEILTAAAALGLHGQVELQP